MKGGSFVSISIEAQDYFGLPLHIGDFVVSVIVDISGKIDGIHDVNGRIRVSIFDEKAQMSVYDLVPDWLTTQERLDSNT